MITDFAAFVAVSLLVICTPGPDTALTIRNAVSGGRRSGVCTAAGVATGQLVWTIVTSVGVAGLLLAFQPALQVLKIAGAAYLIFLGVQSLRAAFRRFRADAKITREGSDHARSRSAYRQGVISNVANPKMAAFFVSLLPQFVTSEPTSSIALLVLGATFSLMTLLWLSLYAVAVEAFRGVLVRSGVGRAIDAVVGAVLVALGIRLVAVNP